MGLCAVAAESLGGQIRGGDVTAALDQARSQFAAGRYADVIHTLNADAGSASNADGLLWLGRAHLELGDYASAIRALERAVALSPNESEVHRWLGRAYGEEADRTRSLSLAGRVRVQFEEAIRVDAANIAAHRDLLQFHLEAPWVVGGSDRRARHEIEAIAALDPNAGHLARAAYLKEHHDVARASLEYQAVLDSGRPSIDDAYEAAEFYEQVGDTSGLRAAIDAASAINATDPGLLFYKGALDVMTHSDPANAESSLTAYLAAPSRRDRPTAVRTHEWLGRLYEFNGSRAKAIAEYAKVLALSPGRKSAKDALQRLGRD
jgi:tetratricopeptide (TPR) repeat protein